MALPGFDLGRTAGKQGTLCSLLHSDVVSGKGLKSEPFAPQKIITVAPASPCDCLFLATGQHQMADSSTVLCPSLSLS